MTILGPDLVTNGGFDTDTDWTKFTGWSIGSGVASCSGVQTSNTLLLQDVGISVTPTLYKVTFDITAYTAGTVHSRLRDSGAGGFGETRNAIGSYVDYLLSDAGVDGQIAMTANSDFIGSIDNVTCQEVLNSFSNQKRSLRQKILQWRI